jgi:hypothetical protein
MAISRFKTSSVAQGLPKYQKFWDQTAAITPPVSGYTGWYDASQISSVTLNGTKVSTWKDVSGNAYNISNATSSTQPAWTTNTLNGKNVLTFSNSGGTFLTGYLPALGTNYTVFIVIRNTNTVSLVGALWLGSDSTTAGFISATTNGNTWYGEAGSLYSPVSVSMTNNTWYRVMHKVTSGTSNKISLNDSTSATNSSSSLNTGASLTLGGYWSTGSGYNFGGDIAEIILYPSSLTDAQCTSVDTYLKTKWGL